MFNNVKEQVRPVLYGAELDWTIRKGICTLDNRALKNLLHEGSPLMDPFTYRSYRLPPLVLPRLIHELGLDGGTLLGLPFLTLPLLLGLCLELDRYLGGEMLLLDKLLTVTDFLPSHSPNAT